MAATIGALRVVLGADTAQFSKGIRGASADLTLLQRSAKVAGAAVGLALGVGVGAAIAFAGSIKNAINEADKMGKIAQSIGTSVEALSSLAYAANLSEISVEELSSGITRLNRALIDAQQNALSPAAQAFRALGINIQGVKSGADLIPQMAGAFERLADGAGKTDVAAQLFGKNLGTKFIPFLNQGTEAIKAQREEAVALGQVYTGEMAKAADQFNDDLERLQKSGTGLAIKLANDLLPVLNQVVDALRYLSNTTPEQAINDAIDALSGKPKPPLAPLSFAGMQADLGGTSQADKVAAADELAAALNAQAQAATAAREAQQLLDQTISEGVGLAQQALSPWDEYIEKMKALKAAQDAGKISAEQLGAAQLMAAASAVQPWLQVASTIGGALGTLFEESKTVAIAQALINVAQGVTAALAQYPPPLSFAMAAAQAAAGAAQIAMMKSTRPGSSGSARRPSAGGGSGAAVAAQASQTARPQQGLVVNLIGEGAYSREQVLGIMRQMVDLQKDGATLILTQT